MKKYMVIVLIVFCTFEIFASEDEVFKRGDSQISFGLAATSGSDYSLFYLNGGYGYFLTNRLVLGPAIGLYVTSDSDIIYEPMATARFYIMNRRPAMPFIGVNTGYIYSPNYTYRTSYTVFCDASIDAAFAEDEFESELSILRLSPEAGVSYLVSKHAVATLTVSMDMFYPMNEEPEKGYKLEETGSLSVKVGFSMML
ncbi:MAG: hypothetical protein JXK07_10505 [Spirochaetes bacterium]|nr:hypothetical protein [Spirochaetota bacterium]MBN2769304.1 hypothetical protein [Spirochaetota bacterium]